MRLGDDGLLIHASSIPRTCGFWSFRPPFEILSSVYFRNSILQFAEKNESIQRRSTLGTSLTKAVQPFSMNRTAVGLSRPSTSLLQRKVRRGCPAQGRGL